MKNLWEKIKLYTTLVFGGIVAGALIMLKLNSIRDGELDVEAAKLHAEDEAIDSEIEALEDDLENIEAEDLTDEEVVDYWENT